MIMIIRPRHIDDYEYEWLYLSDHDWRSTGRDTLYKQEDGMVTNLVSTKKELIGFTGIACIYTNPRISPENIPLSPTEKAELRDKANQPVSLASLMGGM